MVDTLVLLGTTKGLFALRSGDGRERFELTGPSFAGEEIYATCIDVRGAIPAPVLRLGEQPLGSRATPLG